MRLGIAIEDVHQRIHNAISDDADWTLQNSRLALHNAFATFVQDEMDRKGNLSPGFLYRVDCIVVEKNGKECGPCGRYYIELPWPPVSLTNDLGLFRVIKENGKHLYRALNEITLSRYDGLNKPRGTEYFYREGLKIYVKGGHYTSNTKLSAYVVPSIFDAPETLNWYPPEAVMERAVQFAVNQGRETVHGPKDILNDGEDNKQ